MVCFSADQSSENLLENNGADVKRSRLEGRNGIFDVEMDSGMSGPLVTSRPDRDADSDGTGGNSHGTSTARPPEIYVPEIRVHSNSGGGDVVAEKKMVICGPFFADPAKTKVISKVVRYTNILGALVSYLPNEDGKLIDTGQIIIAQKREVCKNDIHVMMVSWEHCVSLPRTGTSLL